MTSPTLTADGNIVIDSEGRRWDPRLHPRGRNGRFIEVGGLVKLFTDRGPNTEDKRRVVGLGIVRKINSPTDIEVEITTGSRRGEHGHFTNRQMSVVPPTEVRLDRGARFERGDVPDEPVQYNEDVPRTIHGEKNDSYGQQIPAGFERDVHDQINERYVTADGKYSVIVTGEPGRPSYAVRAVGQGGRERHVYDARSWGKDENEAGSVQATIGGDRAQQEAVAQLNAEQRMPFRSRVAAALGRNGFDPELGNRVQSEDDTGLVRSHIAEDPAYETLRHAAETIRQIDAPNEGDRQRLADWEAIDSAVRLGIRGPAAPRLDSPDAHSPDARVPDAPAAPNAPNAPAAPDAQPAPELPQGDAAPNGLPGREADMTRPRHPANEGFEDLNVPVALHLQAVLPQRQRVNGPAGRDERNAKYAIGDVLDGSKSPEDRRRAAERVQFLLRRAARGNPQEFGHYATVADRLIAPRQEQARLDTPDSAPNAPDAPSGGVPGGTPETGPDQLHEPAPGAVLDRPAADGALPTWEQELLRNLDFPVAQSLVPEASRPENRRPAAVIRQRGEAGFPDSSGDMLHVGDRVRMPDGREGTITRFDRGSQRAVIRTPNGVLARKANRIQLVHESNPAPAAAVAPQAPQAPQVPSPPPVQGPGALDPRVQVEIDESDRLMREGYDLERQGNTAGAAARFEGAAARLGQAADDWSARPAARSYFLNSQIKARREMFRVDPSRVRVVAELPPLAEGNLDMMQRNALARVRTMRRMARHTSPEVRTHKIATNADAKIYQAISKMVRGEEDSATVDNLRAATSLIGELANLDSLSADDKQRLTYAQTGMARQADRMADRLARRGAPSADLGGRSIRPAGQPQPLTPEPAAPIAHVGPHPLGLHVTPGDFSEWGMRAADIEEAGTNRPGLAQIWNMREDNARRDELQRTLGDAFNAEISGFRTNVTTITRGADQLTVQGEIINARTGRSAGHFIRVLRKRNGKFTIYNSSMSLNRDQQGGGFAQAFNRRNENWYIANGISHVSVMANVDVGGYAWARTGFDWDPSAQSAQGVLGLLSRIGGIGARDREITQQVQELSDRVRAVVARRGDANDPEMPTPFELSRIGWRPGMGKDEMWAGKSGLLGVSWSGRKTLKPDDRAYAQLVHAGFEPSLEQPPTPAAGVSRAALDSASLPDALRSVTQDMVQRNRIPGFTSRSLADANVNDTYLLTETTTGRKFVYKRTVYAGHGDSDRQSGAEIDAGALLRGSGYQGAAYVERVSPEAIITTWVGEQNAHDEEQIKLAAVYGRLNLEDPAHAIRLQIFDVLINNRDRHANNLIVSYANGDANRTGPTYLLPFDHGGGFRSLDEDVLRDVFRAGMRTHIQDIATALGPDASANEIRRYAEALKQAAGQMPWQNGNDKQAIIDRAQRIFDNADEIARRWIAGPNANYGPRPLGPLAL